MYSMHIHSTTHDSVSDRFSRFLLCYATEWSKALNDSFRVYIRTVKVPHLLTSDPKNGEKQFKYFLENFDQCS